MADIISADKFIVGNDFLLEHRPELNEMISDFIESLTAERGKTISFCCNRQGLGELKPLKVLISHIRRKKGFISKIFSKSGAPYKGYERDILKMVDTASRITREYCEDIVNSGACEDLTEEIAYRLTELDIKSRDKFIVSQILESSPVKVITAGAPSAVVVYMSNNIKNLIVDALGEVQYSINDIGYCDEECKKSMFSVIWKSLNYITSGISNTVGIAKVSSDVVASMMILAIIILLFVFMITFLFGGLKVTPLSISVGGGGGTQLISGPSSTRAITLPRRRRTRRQITASDTEDESLPAIEN